MNKCITQAGEDEPVQYNFDILTDQVPHKDDDNYTLVWMVSSQSSESVWKLHKETFVLNWLTGDSMLFSCFLLT